MKIYARFYSLPIIKWKKTIATATSTALSESQMAKLFDENDDPWEYFVFNAPGAITENICPALNLSNGTSVVYKSLSLKYLDDIAEDEYSLLQADISNISNATAGDEIILNFAPVSVNVCIPGDPTNWPRKYRQSDTSIIIPCIRESKPDALRVISGLHELSIPTYSLRCQLAFSRTYHKMQGCTVPRVILDLSSTVQLPMFFVGITRVRLGNDLRILLPSSWQEATERLKRLTRNKNLVLWLSSYTADGTWSPKVL